MIDRNRMVLITNMAESLLLSVRMYDANKVGEFDFLFKDTDMFPPTKTAIQRKITVMREELLALSKEL